MANTLTIPRSNVLRFVNQENYETNVQSFDNKFLPDELWNVETVHPYFQKFHFNDDIHIQFTSVLALSFESALSNIESVTFPKLFVSSCASKVTLLIVSNIS